MADKQQQHGVTTYTIRSADGVAAFTVLPERGAFGSSLVLETAQGPREMLHQHDFFWDKEWKSFPGGFPFLFPVCARIARDGQKGVYLIEGKQYELDIHGFGWHSAWEVVDDMDDAITLRLQASESTLAVYPFDFEVLLRFEIKGNEFVVQPTITNRGDNDMPYYAGFHPYLAMPPANDGKDKVMLDYKPVRRFKYNEAMTDIIGEQPLFKLPTSITNPEILEQLTLLGDDKEVRLHLPDGLTIHLLGEGVEDKDMLTYLQLYTIEDQAFFCAEHWMGFPNALNTVKGVRWLHPGQSETGSWKIWVSE